MEGIGPVRHSSQRVTPQVASGTSRVAGGGGSSPTASVLGGTGVSRDRLVRDICDHNVMNIVNSVPNGEILHNTDPAGLLRILLPVLGNEIERVPLVVVYIKDRAREVSVDKLKAIANTIFDYRIPSAEYHHGACLFYAITVLLDSGKPEMAKELVKGISDKYYRISAQMSIQQSEM